MHGGCRRHSDDIDRLQLRLTDRIFEGTIRLVYGAVSRYVLKGPAPAQAESPASTAYITTKFTSRK